LSLDTTNEAVDWVCTLLAKAIAVDDIHISEYVDREYVDLQADTAWTFTIQIYLPEDGRTHQRIRAIASMLEPLHRTGLTTELQILAVNHLPEKSQNVKQNSLIRRIGDHFVILSPESNYQVNNPQEIVLRLQTSLAFGIGWHPATILSLQLLERHVNPTLHTTLHTLDLGSGSGILSVAMAKLGATVLAIDNDRMAVSATQDAVQRNQVEAEVTVMCGSLGSASQLGHWMGGDSLDPVEAIAANQSFDLIVANIFARVHISLANEFYQALRTTAKHSGILITAGYTSDRDEDIILAMSEAGLSVCDRLQIDEWSAIAFSKITSQN
jgi:ribosomal protein L11 methyltransferase